MNPKELSQLQIRDLLSALRDLGFYKGEVDGLWGRGSESALKAFTDNGGDIEDLVKPRLTPLLLYDKALWNHPIANFWGVMAPFIKNIVHINTPLHYTSEGILLLAIALYLNNRPKNADKVIANKGSITTSLGKTHGHYYWTQLNGNKLVHEDREPGVWGWIKSGWDLVLRPFTRPAEHVFGGFDVTETPDSYIITDDYNFNESGTKYANNRLGTGKDGAYDAVRALAPSSEKNTQHIKWKISKETVNKWLESDDVDSVWGKFKAAAANINPVMPSISPMSGIRIK